MIKYKDIKKTNSYEVGSIVIGMVTGTLSYGIFLAFDDNVTGLIHISEISDFFVRNIYEYANYGEKIRARVLSYDKNNRRVTLSLKGVDDYIVEHHVIKETKNGFSTLDKMLDVWIDEKLDEISDNQ